MRALVLLLLCGTASAAPWTGILAPERAIDWTRVGIPGGIPTRTTVCSSLTAGASTATVQAAIDACQTGQVVSFGSGTFNITSIYVPKGITLRGAGPNSTYLNVTGNIRLGIADPSTAYVINWTGGYTRGSTVLTLASTTGLSAGMTISLDELNPSWVHTMGYNGDCGSANPCGRGASSPWWYASGSARALMQLTKIVSVDSSTQITIRDPVAYTHSSGLSPSVFYWTSAYGSGNVEGAGIENMKVYSNDNAWTVDISHCDYCYARNLWITQNARGAIRAYWSYGFVVRDNYIDSTNTGAPTQYGYEFVAASYGLVENNIAYTVTAPFMPETSFGIVFGYNFTLNRAAQLGGSTYQFADAQPHLAHNAFHLWEGNVGGTLDYDIIWGSASHGTIFRNWYYGKQPGRTSNTRVIEVGAFNRYLNFAGNVLGDTTVSQYYQCVYASPDGTNNNINTIWDVSNWHTCQGAVVGASGSGEVPSGPPYGTDPVTLSSLMRWGNWDAVTYNASGGTAKGTRWCTGSGTGSSGTDAYNTACTADERGTDSNFLPLSNPATTFPASLYNGTTGAHASCGTMLSFWKNPGSGYCPAYPPIGPDVTCSSNCNSNVANHAAKIPAQLCYENSAKDGNGYLTAYDAAACYSADTGAKPNAPTGVH